ncbi:MAG TPA: ATP-binding protein [Thermoplasmata archaeon]|nr:ATP-binding protein [Thermoplasmata archaeon]
MVVAWSSGKDCALALHELRQSPDRVVVGLLTTLTREFDRVSMHGVRRELLDRQALAAGLPLHVVEIPSPCPNEVYERAMGEAIAQLERAGVDEVAFGDLFLEDVRAYREAVLKGTGVTPIFPLWGRRTLELAKEIPRLGFDARVVCLDPRKVPKELAGRRYDEAFLADLPEGVDPCGENGEFHTCVVAGPIFRRPIRVRTGPVVVRDGFVFADLLPEPELPGPTP